MGIITFLLYFITLCNFVNFKVLCSSDPFLYLDEEEGSGDPNFPFSNIHKNNNGDQNDLISHKWDQPSRNRSNNVPHKPYHTSNHTDVNKNKYTPFGIDTPHPHDIITEHFEGSGDFITPQTHFATTIDSGGTSPIDDEDYYDHEEGSGAIPDGSHDHEHHLDFDFDPKDTDDFDIPPEVPGHNIFEDIPREKTTKYEPPTTSSTTRMTTTTTSTVPTFTDHSRPDMDDDVIILTKDNERHVSIFAQPGMLAGFIGGAVMGLLCAILLVMFIVYRMRKKDEGSYPLDEPKRVPLTSAYAHNEKEIYA